MCCQIIWREDVVYSLCNCKLTYRPKAMCMPTRPTFYSFWMLRHTQTLTAVRGFAILIPLVIFIPTPSFRYPETPFCNPILKFINLFVHFNLAKLSYNEMCRIWLLQRNPQSSSFREVQFSLDCLFTLNLSANDPLSWHIARTACADSRV